MCARIQLNPSSICRDILIFKYTAGVITKIMINIGAWTRKDSLILWLILLCCAGIYIKWKYSQRTDSTVDGIRIYQVLSVNIFSVLLGYFWVLSDSHVDILYRNDGDPATRCRNVSLNNMTKIIRKFGHFDCDTPMELLSSAMSAAKKIDPNIDFLIWLG